MFSWSRVGHIKAEYHTVIELLHKTCIILQKGCPKPKAKNKKARSSPTPALAFKQLEVGSVFSLWPRVGVYQCCRSKHHILITDPSSHRFFLIGRAIAGMRRGALDSVTNRDILLMVVPNQLSLLFCYHLLRQSIVHFGLLFREAWKRGTDFVGFVNSLKMMDLKLAK